jgi:hypothetical protein
VGKKSRNKKEVWLGEETNKSWNAETIWILSPLIPFFIPLEAPMWWRHSDSTSKTSGSTPSPSIFGTNSILGSSVIPITSPYLNAFLISSLSRQHRLFFSKRLVIHCYLSDLQNLVLVDGCECT